MESILLDLGGEYFGSKTKLPTFSNNLDANTYLKDFQDEFVSYVEDRMLMSQLISKMSSAVKSIPWYTPITYTLYLNNIENQSFVGTLKERSKQVKEVGLTKVLRFSILGAEESRILIGVAEKDLEAGVEVANCLQVLADREIEVPKVDVVIPDINSSNYIERTLYREVKDGSSKEVTFVDIIFVVKDNSEFLDSLENKEAIIHFVSDALEKLEKFRKEN